MRSRHAGRRRSAGTSKPATTVAPRELPTTPVAIVTVQSVRGRRGRSGWRTAKPNSCPFPIYFHLVFTLPAPIAEIAFQNKAVVYAILFKAAADAMTALAANPRRLGARIGGLAILHTWGQALTHHPHVHCVVPGGGLSSDGARWVAKRPNFFLAIKPLSRLFRRLFLERLQATFQAGMLGFFNSLTHLADRDTFAALIQAMRRIDWVVYAKKPFGGPAQVLAYLGRYTHRVAIANSRVKTFDDDHVAFTWKDYRQNGAEKIMRLKPDEFIRRFLLHALPDGFHRIRYFGFMANGHRAKNIALCRALLVDEESKPENASSPPDPIDIDAVDANRVCPDCGGAMRIIERIPPASPRRHAPTPPFRCDTS